MVKTAAVVILYNPQESTEKNIALYINYVQKLYVIDNSPKKTTLISFSEPSQQKIQFLFDGGNAGIAKRLNQACELAIQDGFDFLLTMDQDSHFDKSAIAAYLKSVTEFENKNNVAMFGVNYKQPISNESCAYKKVNFLITSGSIINLACFKQIGYFDENLFIDFVDTEYCFRAIKGKYSIIEFSNIYMQHNLGERSSHTSIKNFKTSTRSFHSATRLYYMLRNFLYVQNIYKKDFKTELKEHRKDIINRIKNKLLYKKNKLQTIQFLLKAFKDYKQKKMGKIE